MIQKQDVIDFFDRLAENWDAELIRSDTVIGKILDNAGVKAGIDVLDVACGTGVLFPDYLSRNVHSVTGIDISPEMAKRAAEKFPGSPITVLCGDVEETAFDRQFDVVMVYNAFPHFPDPEKLIASLAKHTKTGGRLSVAHGMSREKIDNHHSGSASKVSNGLMHEDQLKELFEPYFAVDVVISDTTMYQVSGVRRTEQETEALLRTRTPVSVASAQTKALLRYMTEHNEHHASELEGLLKDLPKDAAARLNHAITIFQTANAELRAVLESL